MDKKINMSQYIDLVKQGVVSRENIPMGLNAGWPYVTIRNRQICVTIPYFRAELKPDDKTLLYPISYTITTTWPSAKVVGYNNLRYDRAFNHVNFDKPVGTFRHEAVKKLNRKEYLALRDEVYSLYDELIDCISNNAAFEHQPRFTELLQQLMEPAYKTTYLYLCKPFFGTYLADGKGETQ